MRCFRYLFSVLMIFAAGSATALRCSSSTFEEIAVIPNSPNNMMVMGQVDADFVFRGVIVGPTPPDRQVTLQIANQFRGPQHPLWGSPRLPTDQLLMGPVVRDAQGVFSFIGNMCHLMTWSSPDDALVARVRQCQRDGVCPE